MAISASNLDIARRYFAAIEAGEGFETVAQFLAPDVVQEEFPNRLVPAGAKRDLAALREAGERGKKAAAGQRYEIVSSIETGDSLALEVIWSATLNLALGSIPVGGTMRARFAVFLDFRDGKIVRQRNYDCFDPF